MTAVPSACSVAFGKQPPMTETSPFTSDFSSSGFGLSWGWGTDPREEESFNHVFEMSVVCLYIEQCQVLGCPWGRTYSIKWSLLVPSTGGPKCCVGL